MVDINYSAIVGLCLELLGAVLAIPCVMMGGFCCDSGDSLVNRCAFLGFAGVPFGLLTSGALTSIFGISPWCLLLFPSPTLAFFALCGVLDKLQLGRARTPEEIWDKFTMETRRANAAATQTVFPRPIAGELCSEMHTGCGPNISRHMLASAEPG